MADIAKELGASQAQVAMAWVLVNKDVSTAITGATKPEQLTDIVGAIDVYKKLTPEMLKKIEDTAETKPTAPMDFRKFAPIAARR